MATRTGTSVFHLCCFIFLCFLAQETGSIRCKCTTHSCPGDHVNETCTTDGQCYKKIEVDNDDDGVEFITYGCLPSEEKALMQCNTPDHVHAKLLSVKCCKNEDLCNEDLRPVLPSTAPPTTVEPLREESEGDAIQTYKILFISAGVCGVIFIIFLTFFCYRLKASQTPHPFDFEKYGSPYMTKGETLQDMLDQSSGSGSGLPLLVQRTIAKQVTLIRSVGKGRYGEVWQARWRGEDVAVKIFLSHCESSWQRETEIYQTVLLRHESVLGFIASDIIGSNQVTQMYLITDYHPYGSLYDFLRCHGLNKKTMVKLALSASAGLTHLHTEIQGTKGKPPIAHRDIKSKNILVKENLTCCIADFGLAVKYSSDTEEIDIKPDTRVGTRRYMAPEVLDNALDCRNFAAFKMADIYSFGLVLWEIARRCFSDETGMCEEYQVPYFDMLPGDPSFDEVRKVVLTEKRRPSIPNRWHRDETLQTMAKLMTECWAQHPAARLTALRVQKTMNKLKKSMDFIDQRYELDDDSPRTSVTTA